MRTRCAVVVLALAGVAFAAPVPRSKSVDPGKAWEFPDLDSRGWEKQDSGLKVWDVKVGEGDEVKAGAVKVNYTGWLTDGKAFDSTLDEKFGHKEPISFGLNQVIKGWQEGMIGMKPGGIRRLYIPPELGYGKNGAGSQIPGDATLVFVIEYIGPGGK